MSTALPIMRPVDLASATAIATYFKASKAVCPFIEPAAQANLLFAADLTPECHSAADIHPRLFELMVPLVEAFRDARRTLPDRPSRLLVCHTAVIHVPPQFEVETGKLLAWPNWLSLLLKQLYTPKEVVFGFVREGAVERAMNGRPVPVCPFHAIIIRSRVVGSDLRFFPGNQMLLQAMIEAEDDGRDVHAAIFGQTPDIRDPLDLRRANYFDRVRQWGQAQLPPR